MMSPALANGGGLEGTQEEQRWKAEAEHLRRMVDGAADALLVHDTQGRFVDVNESACLQLGYTRQELLAMSVPDIELDFNAAGVEQAWARMQPGESVTIRGQHQRKDGSTFPVEVRVSLLSETSDGPERRLMLALVRDISERVEQEARLRRAEAAALEEREKAARERAAELFRVNQALTNSLDALAAQSPLYNLELDAFLQRVTEEARLQTGAAVAHLFLLDETLQRLELRAAAGEGADAELWGEPLPVEDSLAWRRLLQTRIPLVSDFSRDFVLWPEKLNWHRQQGHTHAIVVPLKDGEFMGLLALAFGETAVTPEEVELSRVFALQATLAIQLARLAGAAGREATRHALLEERNRLAREIHDALAQSFTGIVMHLQAADVILPPESSARALVGSARDLARDGLSEARRSVHALRPQRLENNGICEALGVLLHEMLDATAVRSQFKIEGVVRALTPEVEANLLRIAQEAISNALRHAEPKSITLTLQFEPDAVELRVRDDGHGFVMDSLQNQRAREDGGFGLESMAQRAASLSGQFSIDSQIEQGTEVRARVVCASE